VRAHDCRHDAADVCHGTVAAILTGHLAVVLRTADRFEPRFL
jgi:hypothetical protein